MNQESTPTQDTDEQSNAESPKANGNPSVPFRNPKKSKPTHVLPSDRLSSDKQLEALRAFVAASEAKGGPVTNDEAGTIINMSGMTVVVTNAFFTEVGLLVRADSGQFTPAQFAKDYQAAYVWDPNTAGAKLAPAFRDGWFAKALTPRLTMRPLTKSEAVAVLAEACKASPEYQSRLTMILEFLNVAGIVSFAGDEVRPGTAGGAPPGPSAGGGSNGGTGGGPNNPPPPPPPPGEMIPVDAPFIYVDPQKTKKVVLIAPSVSVTKKEFERIKAWFDLQFFVEDQ